MSPSDHHWCNNLQWLIYSLVHEPDGADHREPRQLFLTKLQQLCNRYYHLTRERVLDLLATLTLHDRVNIRPKGADHLVELTPQALEDMLARADALRTEALNDFIARHRTHAASVESDLRDFNLHLDLMREAKKSHEEATRLVASRLSAAGADRARS